VVGDSIAMPSTSTSSSSTASSPRPRTGLSAFTKRLCSTKPIGSASSVSFSAACSGTSVRAAFSTRPMPRACSPGRAPAASASMAPFASRATIVRALSASSLLCPAPFALERLHAAGGLASLSSPEARLLYPFPKPTPDGRTEILLSPLQLLGRIARFVPPPRMHRHRYHGVLAPNARARPAVIAIGRPQPEPAPPIDSAPANSYVPRPISNRLDAPALRGSAGRCSSPGSTKSCRFSAPRAAA
jgi:hypothetical protein